MDAIQLPDWMGGGTLPGVATGNQRPSGPAGGSGGGSGGWGGGADTGVVPGLNITPRQHGGWLREAIWGVGASGTYYSLHPNEYVSPAGARASAAAAANEGRGGGIHLNVESGAVQISGANGPAQDWAAAADGLWDDLYAKLTRALDNRVQGVGAY
jgi:hypothetical protein